MLTKTKHIIKQHFYRPKWYSIIINPYFIVRRGLLKKITNYSKTTSSNQDILDVGCGAKPYRDLFITSSYIGIDIKGGGHSDQDKTVDKFYNGSDIPFPSDSFDVVICTEVLEHVNEPQKLLCEISRVLKTGGQLFLTMPFVWNEHEIPSDFYRFTRFEHQQLFKQSGLFILKLEETTGVFGVCGQLISAFIFENLFSKNKILKLLTAIIFCCPIQVFFIILDFIFRNSWITLNYSVIATKQSQK